MSLVVAFDDINPDLMRQVRVKGVAGQPEVIGKSNGFFRASIDIPDSPTASLAEWDPGRYGYAHYHAVNQFQIILKGKGKFGRHDVSRYNVHFTRPYTPYGPLVSDKETGWSLLSLRTHYDPGPQDFPVAQGRLKQIPDRRPWQIHKQVTFPAQGQGINLQYLAGIKDDQGLFACALTMAPRTRTAAPDPSGGDGQFVVMVKGSLVYDNREHKAPTIVFVKPAEDAFQIHAGAQGLEALILNFPQVKPRAVDTKAPSVAAGFKKWQCVLCDFAYDEALGMPEDGIPAGTRWKDVPESWSCPDCSAGKSDFQMVEV